MYLHSFGAGDGVYDVHNEPENLFYSFDPRCGAEIGIWLPVIWGSEARGRDTVLRYSANESGFNGRARAGGTAP